MSCQTRPVRTRSRVRDARWPFPHLPDSYSAERSVEACTISPLYIEIRGRIVVATGERWPESTRMVPSPVYGRVVTASRENCISVVRRRPSRVLVNARRHLRSRRPFREGRRYTHRNVIRRCETSPLHAPVSSDLAVLPIGSADAPYSAARLVRDVRLAVSALVRQETPATEVEYGVLVVRPVSV